MRHINSKHRDNANEESNVPSFTKVGLVNIVSNVKLKITEEGFCDNGILSNLANVSSNDTHFDALLPLFVVKDDFVVNIIKTTFSLTFTSLFLRQLNCYYVTISSSVAWL